MAPPSADWLTFVDKGGVVGVLLAGLLLFAWTAYRLYTRLETISDQRLKDHATHSEQIAKMLQKSIEAQNANTLVIDHQGRVLERLEVGIRDLR